MRVQPFLVCLTLSSVACAQATWTQMATPGPPARSNAGLVFDSLRGRSVLFGGFAAGGTYLADTWEWNGLGWASRPGPGPAARQYHGMAFDSLRGRTVLF